MKKLCFVETSHLTIVQNQFVGRGSALHTGSSSINGEWCAINPQLFNHGAILINSNLPSILLAILENRSACIYRGNQVTVTLLPSSAWDAARSPAAAKQQTKSAQISLLLAHYHSNNPMSALPTPSQPHYNNNTSKNTIPGIRQQLQQTATLSASIHLPPSPVQYSIPNPIPTTRQSQRKQIANGEL